MTLYSQAFLTRLTRISVLVDPPHPATTLKQGDPTWIGSWWLGYVICSVIVTLFAIPIFFFPKSLSNRKKAVVMETDDAGLLEQLKGWFRIQTGTGRS